MADIINPSSTGMTHNADVYWHYAGDPVQRAQLLGTFTIGAPQKVLLPIPADADIVLRCVPRGGRGQGFMAGPGDATPHTISALGVGTGGGTSNFYQQLRVNHGYSYGTTPTPRPALNLLQSFQIKDDAVYGESDLSTFGVPTGMLNLRTDFNASGQIAVTTITAFDVSGSVTVETTLELQPGMGILVEGAGLGPSNLQTTVTAVSADGKTYTLASALFSSPAIGGRVQADDTAAVQSWLNAGGSPPAPRGDLTMPPGYYRLSSSITLPTTSEGFSIVIHGSGWDQSQFVFQHGGDGFIPTSSLKIDSMVFKDLTVATGTRWDASGLIDAASKGIGIRMSSPTFSDGIYNNFVLQRCRIIGWGRWGIWSDNIEVSWISQCIFRENGSGHVAFVAPDTQAFPKQPNANTITDSTFDQAKNASPSDVKNTVSGHINSGSQTLDTISGYSLVANDRGRFVIVHGASVGGGDLFTFIDAVLTGSSCTLAHKANTTVSGASVEIAARPVASILLNRANDTVIDGATIQGNFGLPSDPSQMPPNGTDINAIRVYHAANCRFIGIHEEDAAGIGGAAIRMEDCSAMSIENWGGTSAGAPTFVNAHGVDFQLIACHGVRVAQSYFNDRPQFEIDSTSSEIEIDNSWVVGYINLWQQDNSWDKLRIGSGVRIKQTVNAPADYRTNQCAGNEYIYDSQFGRDLITNGRFIDGSGGLEGWTTTNPTWWNNPLTAQTRFGSYIKIDATAITASTAASTIFHQAVLIPDSLPAGLFTLAFDWFIASQSLIEQNGYYVEVRLHPSTGSDEAMQFTTRNFAFVMNTWQTAQIRCWLGSGTSRNIDVQMNVTPGSNVPVIRLSNFRLTPGKHSFGAYERGIHDFGGRMHAPIEFASIATTGTGSTSPPPVGATYMSMVNDSGTLKLGYNGVWTNVGTGTGTGLVISGTPNHFAMFNSPSGNNVVNAPVEFAFGQVHFISVGAWIDFTLPIVSVYSTGQTTHLVMVESDDVVYLGPRTGTAGTTAGANVTIRAGRGTSTTAYKSSLQIDGVNGLFTLNNNRSANTTDTLRVTLPDLAFDGVVVQQPPGTSGMLYLGSPFAYRDLAGSTTFFGVDHNGGINFINSRQYTWPSTTPVVSGGLPMVLAYSSQATANNPVTLAWIPMSGASGGVSGSGTVNVLPKWTITGLPASLGDSGFSDDGVTVLVLAGSSTTGGFELRHRTSDWSDMFFRTSGGTNYAQWRYMHASGSLFGPGNAVSGAGEMHLFLQNQPSTPTFFVGGAQSWFQTALRVRPFSGYSQDLYAFECWAPGASTANFRIKTDGDLSMIKSIPYIWPITTPVVSGGVPMVLAYTAQTVVNAPVTLSWIQMTGGTGSGITAIGPNVANVLPKWSSSPGVSVRDSGISDDGVTVTMLAGNASTGGFIFQHRVNDFIDVLWRGNTANQAIWRYQHSSASLADSAANSPSGWGEMQLFMQTQSSPSFFVGNAHSWFQSALRVRPFSGYSTDLYSFECWAPGGSSANFRIKTDGDLSMIKSVAYIWPGAPTAAGQVLTVTNSTTGALAWQAPTGGGVTWNSGSAGPLTNVLTKWTPGSAPYTIQNSSITDSGIQVTVANPFKVSISGTDKFTVNNVGALFTAGSTRFGSSNIQFSGGTQYNILSTDRTVVIDTANQSQTVNLPTVAGNQGMIIDIIGMRQIIHILNAGSGADTGYTNSITIVANGTDRLNAWGTAGVSWTFPGTNNYKAIRLIADSTYGFWWLIPYYI